MDDFPQRSDRHRPLNDQLKTPAARQTETARLFSSNPVTHDFWQTGSGRTRTQTLLQIRLDTPARHRPGHASVTAQHKH